MTLASTTWPHCSPPMWRTHPSSSRFPFSRHLAKQSFPERRRKSIAGFRTFSLSISLFLLSLHFILRSSDLGSLKSKIELRGSSRSPLAACDIYSGTWVRDDTPPIYNASTCRFAEVGFSCQDNGRPDADYLKWRWKPFGCDIPVFNATDVRHRLRGQRLAFVGDSMGRTQWESFICLLMADISNESSVYEVQKKPITKKAPYLAVKFSTFDITIEYFRSPYLVQEGPPPKHAPRRIQTTLRLDKLEAAETKWIEADILIFNTGHWWTISKTFARGCYFQIDKSVKLGLSLENAYRFALSTWANWVMSNVNVTKTQVFFRSYEPAHWEGNWRDGLCRSETMPVLNMSYTEEFPHLSVLQDVVQRVHAPITILNITSMSAYRRDSHVANWTRDRNVVDCGHWCLPGLPDSWNRLLYAALLQRGEGSWA